MCKIVVVAKYYLVEIIMVYLFNYACQPINTSCFLFDIMTHNYNVFYLTMLNNHGYHCDLSNVAN